MSAPLPLRPTTTPSPRPRIRGQRPHASASCSGSVAERFVLWPHRSQTRLLRMAVSRSWVVLTALVWGTTLGGVATVGCGDTMPPAEDATSETDDAHVCE